MKKMRLKKAMGAVLSARSFRARLFIEGIGIGAVTGLFIVLFRWSIEKTETFWSSLYSSVQSGKIEQTGLIFFLYAVLAVLLYLVTWKEPMASGSGIPQIKGILLGRMHMNWLRVFLYKLAGGILAIGSGLSLGREGPSVQLGAAIGQGVSRLSRRSRFEERFLLTSGAGAGLAAAFNAPLAGVVFCLEELQKNFSPFVLMAAISATVTATAVAQQFFGAGPVFHMPGLAILPLSYYGVLFLAGLFLAVLGRCFNKTLLRALDFYELPFFASAWKKPLLPVFTAAALGFFLPEILGGGNHLVDDLLNTSYSLEWLCLLFIGKFLFTMLCFGSGVPGGIFLPMLVLGALGGAVFSGLAVWTGAVDPVYAENLIVFSMAGYFAAVVKSPVTGSILIMEMTGSFEHMLALICVSVTACTAADLLGGKPVYDELLSRSLAKQNQAKKTMKYRRLMFETVVGAGSAMDGKQIRQIAWPKYSLVIHIRRGESEIIPDAETRLQAGDYLYLFVNDYEIEKIAALAAIDEEEKINL